MLVTDKEMYLEIEEKMLEMHNEFLEKIIDRIEVSIGTVDITELMYYIKKDVEVLYSLDESLNRLIENPKDKITPIKAPPSIKI